MWRPKASVGNLEAVVAQHPKDFRSRLLELPVEVRACLPVRVRKPAGPSGSSCQLSRDYEPTRKESKNS